MRRFGFLSSIFASIFASALVFLAPVARGLSNPRCHLPSVRSDLASFSVGSLTAYVVDSLIVSSRSAASYPCHHTL